MLEAEIATVSTTEGAAYGAAVLAAVGAGWFPDVDTAVATLVRITPVAAPGADGAAYRRRTPVSRAVSRPGPDLRTTLRIERTRPQPRSSISASSFSVTSPGFLPRMIMPSTSSGGDVVPC